MTPQQLRPIKALAVIVAAGILLGIGWAFREFRSTPPPSGIVDVDSDTSVEPDEHRPTFAEYFSILFLGRPGTATRIRSTTPLVRAVKFITGERVGLRTETAASVTGRLPIELRFLLKGTREETQDLRRFRQRFSLRPGLSSSCCVRIPTTPGAYEIGVVVDESYVAFLPATVVPPQNQVGGGLSPRLP